MLGHTEAGNAGMARASAPSRVLPAVLALLIACLVGAPYVAARAALRAAPPTGPAASRSSTSTADVLDRYCVTCHNSRLKTAGLLLDSLDAAHAAERAEQWEKVVTKLRTGEMPPPGRPRPDAATYRNVAAALERDLDDAAAAHPHPGRV